MSILKRFADIMSANFHNIIDKFEDPEKMIDQYLRNLEDDLGKVTSETADVMVIQGKTEAKIKVLAADQNKWLTLAKKAEEAGNMDDAREFTKELIKTEDELLVQAEAANRAKENTDKMLELQAKLVEDMNVLRNQRDELMARNAIAKASARVEAVTGTYQHSADSNIAGYNRMKEKIEDSIRKSEALHTLNSKQANKAEKLAKKYDIGESMDERVEKRLAELKAV